MGLSSVPPVCHPSATGLSWLFPLAPQRAGHILGPLGQPQRRLRLGWDLQGLRGWTGTAPRAWPCPDPTPEPGEAGGDGGSPGWAVGQERSWTAAGPTPLLPTQGQVLLTPPPRCHPRGPAGAPPSPATTVTPGKQGCKERQGPAPELRIPTPAQGAAGEPGGAPHPLPRTSGGILTRVSLLQGSLVLSREGESQEQAFSQVRGPRHHWEGASPCLQGWAGAWGVPECL